jgi:hypothetical protein
MTRRTLFQLLLVALLVTSCELDAPQPSAALPDSNSLAQPAKKGLADTNSLKIISNPVVDVKNTCPYPADWSPYQMQLNETIYSLAARSLVSAADLLKSNCLDNTTKLGAGSWLYVPTAATINRPETFLPLSVSSLVADPGIVSAGSTISLAWQAQGPVVRVRLGWFYQNQFIEEARDLPAMGALALQVPADGRESITYVVRVSDGAHEVAAQTTVQVRCPESWFFSPAPSGCPSPPLLTTFREQVFERGTIVYIPALGVNYVMLAQHPAIQIRDGFVPGMPLKDAALEGKIPAGLSQPSGAINTAWRSNEDTMAALGYTVAPEKSYLGMLQRVVTASGEIIYFSASSGAVYRFMEGQIASVITPQ